MKLLRYLWHGEGMEIDDAKEVLFFGLSRGPALHGAQVVAELYIA